MCNPSSSEVHSDVADVAAEVVRKRAACNPSSSEVLAAVVEEAAGTWDWECQKNTTKNKCSKLPELCNSHRSTETTRAMSMPLQVNPCYCSNMLARTATDAMRWQPRTESDTHVHHFYGIHRLLRQTKDHFGSQKIPKTHTERQAALQSSEACHVRHNNRAP